MSASNLVAEAVWKAIETTRSVTDDQLSILHFLFGKNFERATRIVDQRGVKRISGEPSGCCVFQVVGESRRKEEYFCFAEHYCACYSFFYDIVNRGEQLCCKHQLAARLAAAVGSCVEVKMQYVKPIMLYRGLLKTSSPKRLLGLDVGDKYVGLSVSDSLNKIASPLSVLVRTKTNINLMANDFQTLISELSIDALVIGCCYQRQRSSLNAVQIKLFVRELSKTGLVKGLKYTYWDERFTSKCVEALLKHLHLHPVMNKTILDKFAAVGILQDYLDYMQKNSELEDVDYMQKTVMEDDLDYMEKKTAELEDLEYLHKGAELEDLDYIQNDSELDKSSSS